MGDDTPTVPVVCEACDTTTRVALDDAATTVERHNERLHDGDDHAQIDPELVARLQDLVAADIVAED
jgi:hypothetical protein